ncbi:MAG: restriction endonuclease subunit S [Methylotenera sp.]
MRKSRLKDRVSLDYGYAVRVNNEPKGNYPVFGSNGVTGYINSYKVEGPGVIIGRKGSVGKVSYSNESFTPTDTAYYLRILDRTSDDLKFWFYYLPLLGLEKLNTHSAVPGLSREIAYLIDIDPPKKKEQQKIAAVLSSLDAKIDLNDRINVQLQNIAKSLYDFWFVQFNFPDINGKPYKSSGGKMVYNYSLKREIPDGWVDINLSDVISRSGTGLNPRNNFKLGSGENFYVTIKNINNGKIILDDRCDKVDNEALNIIDRRSQLMPGDVLFTSIEPVGVTFLIHEKPTNWNINESVFTLRPNYKKITTEYLYMLLSSVEMKAFTKNVSTGSIHKGIRHGVLKTFKLPYNNIKLINDFSNIIRPILKQIYNLDNENAKLAELRDWLLPMLMNGQVQVS